MHPTSWQTQWKQPKLHPVQEDATLESEKKIRAGTYDAGYVCSSASSVLNIKESERLIEDLKTIQKEEDMTDNLLSSYILNVTISNDSTIKSPEETLYGNKFVLSICGSTKKSKTTAGTKDDEVEEGREDDSTKKIYTKTLRWPSCALGDANDRVEKGIISVCFCRVSENALNQYDTKPPAKSASSFEEDESEEKIADALDALRLLSLSGLDDATGPSPNNSLLDMSSNLNDHTMENLFYQEQDQQLSSKEKFYPEKSSEGNDVEAAFSEQLLMLCCLTNHGHIHLFPALDLLDPSPPQPDTSNLLDSFATLFFGKSMHQTLENDVLPLSNPILSIPLTLCQYFQNERHQLAGLVQREGGAKRMKLNLNLPINTSGVFDLKFLDATIEPSLSRYHTVANEPTCCISSRDFIIVSGKGVRKLSLERAMNRKLQSYFDSLQKPTEYSPTTKGKSEIQKYDEEIEEGGFISFVSLRHCNETKSIFLPFAPAKLSAITWEGMQFVVCLRGPSAHIERGDLNQTDKADVLCIRIDSGLEGGYHSKWKSAPLSSAFLNTGDLEHSFFSSGDVETSFLPTPRFQEDNAFFSQDDDIHSQFTNSLKSPPEIKRTHDKPHSALSRTLPLRRLHRFKPIPLLGNIRDIVKSNAASVLTQINETNGEKEQYEGLPRVHLLDMNMNTHSTPPSLVAIHEIISGPHIHKMVTLHSFQGLEFSSKTRSLLPHQISHKDQDTFAINRTEYEYMKSEIVIKTFMEPRHFAIIEDKHVNYKMKIPRITQEVSWCLGGQGWSIVGGSQLSNVFFVCWEGANLTQGAHVQPLYHDTDTKNDSLSMPILACNVLGNDRHFVQENKIDIVKKRIGQMESHRMALPAESPADSFDEKMFGSISVISNSGEHTLQSGPNKNNLFSDQSLEFDLFPSNTDIIQEAMDSILESPETKQSEPNITNEGTSRENSGKLLKFCSSWNDLGINEDTDHSQYFKESTTIVTLHNSQGKNFVLTLRREAYANPVAAPFSQILPWLCQNSNYYVASAIALKLLDDIEALRSLKEQHLKSFSISMLDSAFLSSSGLEGLLDGIVPIDSDNSKIIDLWNSMHHRYQDHEHLMHLLQHFSVQSRLEKTYLSDMAIGCMIKGGINMANALHRFLEQNKFYDANRTCLLLAATATATINKWHDDGGADVSARDESKDERELYEEHIWPIRCLLQVAVARNCMETCLKLLNSTIPDKLRSLPHAKEVVTLILNSSSTASSHLLHLVNKSKDLYWDSLDHDTRVVFSLLNIQEKYPMLKEAEVQHWVIESIHKLILKRGGDRNRPVRAEFTEYFSSEWLGYLCTACLENACCDWKNLLTKEHFDDSAQDLDASSNQAFDDGIQKLQQKVSYIQRAITPGHTSGGIDFGILIPALLELQLRSEKWHVLATFSTQELLNEICDSAGRNTPQESTFEFNANVVMRQCALAGNVMAAANLIGGKDGLLLKCCDILMNYLSISTNECEEILLGEKTFDGLLPKRSNNPSENIYETSPGCALSRKKSFKISDDHSFLLLLLERHVLSIRKYGDFETLHTRGRVDPIFAGRVILRAWLCVVACRNEIDSAAHWMKSWLGDKLCLNDRGLRKRLASAALVRILLWPEDYNDAVDENELKSDLLLANELHLDKTFLTQLAQACCGMIESLPKSVASQILSVPIQESF